MQTDRTSVKRTAYYDESTGQMCFCQGDFWKTCALRVINELPCTEAIVSITPIARDDDDPAAPTVRALDKKLAKLTDSIRNIGKGFKI